MVRRTGITGRWRGSANSEYSTVGSPAYAVSSAILVLIASVVLAASAISVLAASVYPTTSPSSTKAGGWVQGAGSPVKAATTPAARNPGVRVGEGERPRVA